MLAAALTPIKNPTRRRPSCGFFYVRRRKIGQNERAIMIIILKSGISPRQEASVLKEIRKRGYRPHVMRGVARTVIGAIGDELTHQSLETLMTAFPGVVESVMPVQKRYKLVSREAHPSPSTVRVRENVIGGRIFHVMAGPCS